MILSIYVGDISVNMINQKILCVKSPNLKKKCNLP